MSREEMDTAALNRLLGKKSAAATSSPQTLDAPTLTAPCRAQLKSGANPCSQTMTWTKGTHWTGRCRCGFYTVAASGDALELDKRAGLA